LEDVVEEEIVDDPEPVSGESGNGKEKKKKVKIVRPLQKHHHLLHYPDLIRKYGPIVLYWCMR
jgi:hypothetical protein